MYKYLNLTQNRPLWWSNCIHNQQYALQNRYLKITPEISQKLDIKLINRIVDHLTNDLIKRNGGELLRTTSISDFLNTYTGALRTRYEKGVQRTFDKGIKSNIEIFIKDEFYWENKPPRTIFARDYGFNAIYGTITKPLEHLFMKHPEFAKGKNFEDRGKQFYDKWLRNKFMIENDFSKFESSQRSSLLRTIELRTYKNMFHIDEHPFIDNIFNLKLKKNISSREGIKTFVEGCRGSGDMDTSLGNGLLNYVACKYFLIKNNLGNLETENLIIDGDDSIIFTNRIDNFVETFSEFGFDCKIITRTDYHDLDFCSGKFIKINTNQFYYIQNIDKLLNTLQFYRPKNNMNCEQYYYTLGIMFKNLYPNFPVFDQISNFLTSKRSTFVKSMLKTKKYEFANSRAKLLINRNLIASEIRTSFNINTALKLDLSTNKMPIEQKFRNVNKITKYIILYKAEYENIKLF